MTDCIVRSFGCSCEEGKCEAGIGWQKRNLLIEPKQTWLERIVNDICDWWMNKRPSRLEKACPELRRLKREEERARRMHRPVKHIQARRQQVMLELLRGNA